MSFILSLAPEKKVFLGAIKHSMSDEFISSNSISIIINCAQEIKNSFPNTVKYFNIPVEDNSQQHISQYFDACHHFLVQNFELKGNILIHCVYGVSRSATVAIALIMKFANFKRQQAQKIVEIRRPEISPNFGFLQQLDIYELQIADSMAQQQQNEEGTQIQEIKKFIEHQAENDFVCIFKCRKCNVELFKSLDITHGIPQTCHSYYVVQPNWWPEELEYSQDGVISCCKCKNKIGAYKLSGIMCSCQEWVAPAYQFQKFKIDRKAWDQVSKKWI